MIPGRPYTPEDIARLAWRWRWIIVLPCIIAAVGAVLLARRVPDRYRSETLILVVPQRVPESYVRSTVTTRIEDRLQSLRQQILSRTRLERVIEDFDLYSEERRRLPMEDVVEAMRLDVNVEIVRGDAFRVSYVSTDPTSAMRVADRLTSLFIDENLRDREVMAEGTSQFLASQLDDARRRLIEHERTLEEYRRAHAGELPSQVQSNLQVVQSTQLQVQSLVESIHRDRDRRLLLERQLAEATTPPPRPAAPREAAAPEPPAEPASPAAVPSGVSAARQLEIVEANLRGAEARLKPAHPDIIRLTRLAEELRGKVAAETAAQAAARAARGADAVTDPAELARLQRASELEVEIERLDAQLAQKEAEEARLRGVSAGYQQRIEASITRESELTELMRDYDTLRGSYTTLLARKEESQIAANLERRQLGDQFRVLDPARLPQRPFSPNRPRIVGVAAVAGLLAGVGLVVLLEYRDTTLKSDADVELVLSLPVLAVVPAMQTARERTRQARLRVALAVARASALVAVVAVVVLVMMQGL